MFLRFYEVPNQNLIKKTASLERMNSNSRFKSGVCFRKLANPLLETIVFDQSNLTGKSGEKYFFTRTRCRSTLGVCNIGGTSEKNRERKIYVRRICQAMFLA